MNDTINEIEEVKRRIASLDAERRALLGRLSTLEKEHQHQQRQTLQQFSSQEKISSFKSTS